MNIVRHSHYVCLGMENTSEHFYEALHYKSCIEIACDAWPAAIQGERKKTACSLVAMLLANQEGIISLAY